MDYFCWDCKTVVEVSIETDGSLLCNRCNGTFVEKVDDDDRPENFARSDSTSSPVHNAVASTNTPRTNIEASIQFVVAPGLGAGNFSDIFEHLASVAFSGAHPFGSGIGAPPLFGTTHHHIGHGNPFGNMNDILAHLMETYDGPMGTPPVAAEVLSSLPAIHISQQHVDAKECCSVCKDEYTLGEHAMQMPCTHLFHKDCIEPWLKRHSTCPSCRYQLPTEDALND
jgi:E3 ubiquitin-protein ligase RNF115/126